MSLKSTRPALTSAAKKQLTAGRKRGKLLIARIERHKAQINETFYDIGECLRELLNRKLYAAMGHETFAAMLDAHQVMGKSQAFNLIRLVESTPREEALRLGHEKAYALVANTQATPEEDEPTARAPKAPLAGKPQPKTSKRDLQDTDKAARARALSPLDRERYRADRLLERKARELFKKVGLVGPIIQVRQDVVAVLIRRDWLQKADLG